MKVFVLLISVMALSAACNAQGAKQVIAADSLPLPPVHTFAQKSSGIIQNGQAIPQNFYTQHLGFFCRQELKMQEAHVPVTFRLGSMDQCNYLEQKPGYR